MNIKDIIDSKKFWKTVKPLINDKCNISSKINLVENDNIVSDGNEIAETFKIFFENAVKNFNVLRDSDSITLIKSNVNVSNNVSDIFKEISSLNSKKQGTKDGILARKAPPI